MQSSALTSGGRSVLIFLSVLISSASFGQTGDPFEVKQSVIAAGGKNAAGGVFSVDSTTGQAVAGSTAVRAPFSISPGFWNFTPLAPTASPVSVSGRVTTANGRGIRNASVTLVGIKGGTRSTRTGSFGFYRFDGVDPGESYLVSVAARRFTFSRPTIVINVFDSVADANFIAN